MKPFNLEKALVGEPVQLRNGKKAYVITNLNTLPETDFNKTFPLIGYTCSPSSILSWTMDGHFSINDDDENQQDIIGMWEEPRPTVTLTLPCPLKEPQEEMWMILPNFSIVQSSYREGSTKENTVSSDLLEQGRYFASKEDALAWVNALKDNRK